MNNEEAVRKACKKVGFMLSKIEEFIIFFSFSMGQQEIESKNTRSKACGKSKSDLYILSCKHFNRFLFNRFLFYFLPR